MSNNNSNDIYKMKQDWMDQIMASKDLTPATKVFAYGIYEHMYGNKVSSFAGNEALADVTGLAKSKFSAYRRALAKKGVLSFKIRKTKNGDGYDYTLVEPSQWGVSTEDGLITRPARTTPMGTENNPIGNAEQPQRDVALHPTGVMNTTSEYTNEEYKEDMADADAPAIEHLSLAVKEEVLVSHPCLIEGTSLNSLGTAVPGGTDNGPSLNFQETITSNGFTYLLSIEGVTVLDEGQPKAAESLKEIVVSSLTEGQKAARKQREHDKGTHTYCDADADCMKVADIW